MRDHFHVGVIGYGGQRRPRPGRHAGRARAWCPISELANSPLRVEQRTRKVDDGAGGLIEQSVQVPRLVRADGDGKTPMCEALSQARRSCSPASSPHHPDCFPPVVINITDGKPTDGNPEPRPTACSGWPAATATCCCSTLHLSAQPAQPDRVPRHARPACRTTSPGCCSACPARCRRSMWTPPRTTGFAVEPRHARLRLQRRPVSVVRFLDIGTARRTWACGDHARAADAPALLASCRPKRGHSADEYEDACAGDPQRAASPSPTGRRERPSRACGPSCWSGFVEPGAHATGRLAGVRRAQRWAQAVARPATLPWYAEAKARRGRSPRFLGLALRGPHGRLDGAWARGRRRQLPVPGARRQVLVGRSRWSARPSSATRRADRLARLRHRRAARRPRDAALENRRPFCLMTDALARGSWRARGDGKRAAGWRPGPSLERSRRGVRGAAWVEVSLREPRRLHAQRRCGTAD